MIHLHLFETELEHDFSYNEEYSEPWVGYTLSNNKVSYNKDSDLRNTINKAFYDEFKRVYGNNVTQEDEEIFRDYVVYEKTVDNGSGAESYGGMVYFKIIIQDAPCCETRQIKLLTLGSTDGLFHMEGNALWRLGKCADNSKSTHSWYSTTEQNLGPNCLCSEQMQPTPTT